MMKLEIFARAELALAQMRAQRAAGRSVLVAVSLVFALLGLGMFNFAAFYYLSPTWGSADAAFIVALVNFAVTGALLIASRRVGPGEKEEKLAREIRDLAYTQINRDVDQVKAEIVQITDDVRNISSSIKSFSGAASNTLGPLMGMLVKALK
jgi:hypothetical protein